MNVRAVTRKTDCRMVPAPVTVLCLFAVAMILVSGGCGSDQPDLGRVRGVVTLDGEPLAGAQILFVPESGRPSSAETGLDGSYRLRYTADAEGALIGPHTVQIRTAVDGRDDPASERLPDRYHSPSELAAEVKAGSNTIDFELTSN